MKTLINAEQISLIQIHQQKESKRFKWFEKEKKWFGLWIEEEGFWSTHERFISGLREKDELTDESFINSCADYKTEGKECYLKAHIIFEMSSGRYSEKYFNTDGEMYKYLEQPELKNIKTINL